MNTLYDYVGDKTEKLKKTEELEAESYKKLVEENKRLIKQNVNFEGFEGKLSELIDGIRQIPNYQNIKGYVREKILPKNPGISYKKLSVKAGVHEGVALVILYDLYNDKLEAELKELEEQDMYYNYS
ncbi:MAG: hypothetical protein ACTSP3_07990 [Candidatus Heimdallarchaeaceae archaeon]